MTAKKAATSPELDALAARVLHHDLPCRGPVAAQAVAPPAAFRWWSIL